MKKINPQFRRRSRTFGPAYDPNTDAARIGKQHEVIRDLLLAKRKWWTLAEIERATDYPQSSISAQLRHLRKEKFGSWNVEKRKRGGSNTCEYRINGKQDTPRQSTQSRIAALEDEIAELKIKLAKCRQAGRTYKRMCKKAGLL